jgi:hypothetical protein
MVCKWTAPAAAAQPAPQPLMVSQRLSLRQGACAARGAVVALQVWSTACALGTSHRAKEVAALQGNYQLLKYQLHPGWQSQAVLWPTPFIPTPTQLTWSATLLLIHLTPPWHPPIISSTARLQHQLRLAAHSHSHLRAALCHSQASRHLATTCRCGADSASARTDIACIAERVSSLTRIAEPSHASKPVCHSRASQRPLS